MNENIYLVITNKGYWGKASNLSAAANNANVRAKEVIASVYCVPKPIVESIGVTGSGGLEWKWADQLWQLLEPLEKTGKETFPDKEKVLNLIRQTFYFGKYGMKMSKDGVLSLTIAD